jgi:hypothetical protein
MWKFGTTVWRRGLIRRGRRLPAFFARSGSVADRVKPAHASGGEAAGGWDEPRWRQIRNQIATGTYLTEDKLTVVVDSLGAVLDPAEGGSERATA